MDTKTSEATQPVSLS